MNIHEYQAKALFEKYGVAVPKGAAARSAAEFEAALAQLPDGAVIVKSQIHAGGRGKGTFTDGFKGGVKFTKSKHDAKEMAGNMLGKTLVTAQTGAAGRKVQTIYFTAASDIKKEYYLAILLDRATSKPVIVASTEGGVEIEKVAEETPDAIKTVHVNYVQGLQAYQCRELGFALGLNAKQAGQLTTIMLGLYKLFNEKDLALVELNPLAILTNGNLAVLDGKVNSDDNATFRHKDLAGMRDIRQEDETEVLASQHDLNYVTMDGNIGCMVNGAGLAMATMDIIKFAGGSPANFLDVGGGANAEQVKNAFRILLSDKHVKAVLINIFGGILRCDTLASGVVGAARDLGIKVPIVVRMEGTNVELGRQILLESGFNFTVGVDMLDAAEKVVKLAAQ